MDSSVLDDFDWKSPDYTNVYESRVAMLERIRKPGFDLKALKEYYSDNPVDFITDFGMTFDPRMSDLGLPTTMPFILFPRQEEFIEWLHTRWQGREDGLAEKSRDMGVSWLCVAYAVWMWLFKTGSVVGFGSRKETYVDDIGNPNSLFWKVRSFISFLPPEFKPFGFNDKVHAPFMKITNPENGSVILGEAGTNIGRGGRTSIYFKDESAFYEQPELIDAALSQTSNCKIDVSTPNGAGNPFYRKRHSGKVHVFIFDWRDDPRKDEAWYKDQLERYDAVVVAQEIDRNYEASVSNAFIPADIVKDAAAKGPADVMPIGGLRIGVDVARFGDDKSVISIRRGRVLLKQVEFIKLDTAQVAAHVRNIVSSYAEKPEQIAVDTIGVGAGVADMLRGWFPDTINKKTGKVEQIVVDVNSALRMGDGQHYNLRAFMWAQMKEWLKTASIPADPELRVDLTALRYEFRAGELLLESKEKAKLRGVKSPDRADSLAMTFAIPTIVAPKKKVTTTPGFQPYDAEMGY